MANFKSVLISKYQDEIVDNFKFGKKNSHTYLDLWQIKWRVYFALLLCM